MSSQNRWLSALAACLLACPLPGLRGADVSTNDGLTLRLDDATGTLQEVRVDDRALPRSATARAGFSCREFTRSMWPRPKRVASISFEEPEPNWLKVGMMKVAPDAGAVIQKDGGAEGAYARVGDHERYGHGVMLKEPAQVRPGGLYDISWQARVPAKSATYIVYIRAYDSKQVDVTPSASPRGKWRYSPWTQTHYQYGIATKAVGVWEPLRLRYTVPEDVHFLRVAMCLWRGDYADVDSLKLEEMGEAVWHDIEPAQPCRLEKADHGVRQRVVVPDRSIEIAYTYQPKDDHIWVEADVRDRHEPVRDRAIEVRYSLPVQAEGWWWDDDIRSRRRVKPGAVYHNVFGCGQSVSLYPFSSIHNGDLGLSLAARLDWPRVEKRSYSVRNGYETAFALGLSRHTRKIGPGRAKVAFAIYRTKGGWGFRRAAEKYYEIFPQFFTKRASREGAWMFVVRPSEVPNLEDFGMTFYEGFLGAAKDRALAREHGMFILPYTEPWGMRQVFPEAKAREDMPPYEERLAQLRAWAADKASKRKWMGGPRHEVAQAVLNSLPTLADGRAPFSVDKYTTWAQWWRTNPDPNLPEPNRATICKRFRIDPVLPQADGIYLDSVSLGLSCYENYRQEHLAASDLPLTFSAETGKPVVLGVMSQYEFIDWLAKDLHGQSKLVHMNIFGRAHRFYAHMADVLGSEVGSSGRRRRLFEVESDTRSNIRRTYAYRKPVTNLLQEGNYNTPVPAITHEQVEQYIKHQAFYGFYPAISSGGGEEKPGYRGWKRYFRSPELRERDRALFKQYIPLIRRINRAGWEPVTYAHTSDPKVFIERFGSWQANSLHFTLRNQSQDRRQATVRVELVKLSATTGDMSRLRVIELLSDTPLKALPREGAVEFEVSMPGFDTWVVHVPNAG